MRSNQSYALLLAAVLLGPIGCGGEEEAQTSQRGLPPGTKKIDAKDGSKAAAGESKAPAGGGSRRSTQAGGGQVEAPPAEPERPRPPRPVLSREDFAAGARDPFHTYVSLAAPDPVPVEVIEKQRAVKLAEYEFEQLKLIAIVNAGRNVEPRALFLSPTDKKSKSVKQGEYFSSAEVLLASVNRDYIEVEVVDPELIPSWNMERGERRVIYLKNDK